MLDLFLRLSGLLAALLAWLFVVNPAIHYGIDGKRQTISSATKDSGVRFIVSVGLVVGSFFQVLFLIHLVSRFHLSFSHIGSILYLSAIFSTILVALFPEYKYSKIHGFFVTYYFLIFPVSLLVISHALVNEYTNLFIFTSFIVFLYFVGAGWCVKKFGISAKVEQWAFLVLSIWTFVFTIV